MRITPINNHQQSLITFQQGEWGILSRIRRKLLWKCIAYPLSFFGTLSGQLLAGPKTFSFPRTTLFVWGCPGNIFSRVGEGEKKSRRGTATLTGLSIIYTHWGKTEPKRRRVCCS